MQSAELVAFTPDQLSPIHRAWQIISKRRFRAATCNTEIAAIILSNSNYPSKVPGADQPRSGDLLLARAAFAPTKSIRSAGCSRLAGAQLYLIRPQRATRPSIEFDKTRLTFPNACRCRPRHATALSTRRACRTSILPRRTTRLMPVIGYSGTGSFGTKGTPYDTPFGSRAAQGYCDRMRPIRRLLRKCAYRADSR